MSTGREKSPYASYYDEGRAAALNGVALARCPYLPVVGPNRLELLTRRVAWAEGHADGELSRQRIVETGRIRGKATRKPMSTRAIVCVRSQRRARQAKGAPERYVERRLRQIADEQQ